MSTRQFTGNLLPTEGPSKVFLASTETFADAKPQKEITDQDLRFLHSLRPHTPLPDLKAHVLENYARFMASGGMKYRCFQSLYYLLPAITDHFLYQDVVAAPKKGLLLDLGGGQGTDARKLIQDGWPADAIAISDLTSFLWEVGLDLFQDGPSGPVNFVEGNILNQADIQPGSPMHTYLGKADVVHAQAVLHLFNADTAKTYAQAAKAFLRPGGLFMGANAGSDPPATFGRSDDGNDHLLPWAFSSATFASLLEEAGFVDVRVEASTFPEFLRRRGFSKEIWDDPHVRPDAFGGDRQFGWLTWSARRPAEQQQRVSE